MPDAAGANSDDRAVFLCPRIVAMHFLGCQRLNDPVNNGDVAWMQRMNAWASHIHTYISLSSCADYAHVNFNSSSAYILPTLLDLSIR